MTEICGTHEERLEKIHAFLKAIPPLSYNDTRELEDRKAGEDESFDHAINLGIRLLAAKIMILVGDKEIMEELLKKIMRGKEC